MTAFRNALCWIAAAALATSASPAAVRVVTSTSDLAAIAREIGGDRVEAESIAEGTQDPHFVELLPSYMIRVRKAAVYVKVGMELDYWAQQILDGSRNAKIVVVDCSRNLPVERRLEVPARADPSQGDVHKSGNPHYWLDPANGKIIAEAIAEGLVDADPAGEGVYRAGLKSFEERLEAKLAEWKKRAEALSGVKIITYHNSWPYFTKAFGIQVVDWIEPKPGIKPSPSHVSRLVEEVRAEKVALIAYEPYFEGRTPALVAREGGIPVAVMPPSVGGVPEVRTYFDLFDYNLDLLAKTLAK